MSEEDSILAMAASAEERRQYRRLAAGVRVRFNELSLGRTEREYLKGVAADVSLGGMFIATRHTFPEGTPIALEFHARDESGSAPVRAHAVVCWRRRWRQPRGMGVQFVDFEFLGQRRLEVWLDTILDKESISA
ncbi:MAG TPA: PilZ domain-containing protein [Thermoanaerobaculia bacterium]|jgi:uncharacterized protein (TIGR02266 family)|nr:PilZ domain-containing protein [Thermoanaerobaculia bacterium]